MKVLRLQGNPLVYPVRALLPSLLLWLLPRVATAQTAGADCLPRVEASAQVAAPLVARLATAVSSGSLDCGAISLVRFDLGGNRLVMTVVLDDGRQVARVLPSPEDALPTLVALTAVPRIASAVVPSPDPTEPEAPAPVAVAPVVPAPPPPRPEVGPVAPPPTRWRLRLGAALGVGSFGEHPSPRASLDVDLISHQWTFGLRAFAGPDERRDTVGGTLSVRRQWVWGRWQLDLGPAASARWTHSENDGAPLSLLVGGESSLAFALTSRLSVFVRVEGGADLLNRSTNRRGEQEDEVTGYYGALAGARWEFNP